MQRDFSYNLTEMPWGTHVVLLGKSSVFACHGKTKGESHDSSYTRFVQASQFAQLERGSCMKHNDKLTSNWFGLGRPKKDGSRPIGPTQLVILRLISVDAENAYAVGIARRLERDGLRITDGAVVRTLHRLEGNRYIETVPQELRQSNSPAGKGRPRKHYRITQSGLGVLAQMEGRLAESQTANPGKDKGFNNEDITYPPGVAPVV